MTPLFAYLLKVLACSGILYGYYWIALRNKVFHSWNRFYLMGSMAISILLPLINFNLIAPKATGNQVITAMQVVAGADEYVTEIQQASGLAWDTTLILNTLYILISGAIMIWLFMGMSRIVKMIRKYPKQEMNDVLFLNTKEQGTPFSYFRYLFWNEAIDPSSANGQKMLEHELVHIREKHSHDKLFVHLVLTIYWINPFFWLIRKELAMVHEFIADQKTVTDTESFAQLILSASFPGHTNLFTNAFFQSSIKRRIAMITKNKNPRFTYISRLLLIPVLFVLIFTFAVKANEILNKENESALELDKKVTVIIDAGHGGEDNGVTNGDLTEKDLNMSIAKRIKALNNNPNLDIVLSREVDITLPVKQRTEIADKAQADLFISLHSSASPNKQNNGIEAYVSARNMEHELASKKIATLVLNNLSSIYKTDNNIKTREKSGIWVLDKNNRPAIILENGFLTNEKDKSFFSQSANQEKIAKAILTSIEQYFSKNVMVEKRIVDTIPAKKELKTITYTYKDGSQETITEEEFKKRNEVKEIKIVKGYKVDGKTFTVDSITSKVGDRKIFIDGKEIPKGTMPVELHEIKSINIVSDENGEKEIHINKKGASASSPKEITVVGYAKNGEKKVEKTVVDSVSNKELTVVGYSKSGSKPSSSKLVIGQKIDGVEPLYILDGKEFKKEDFESLDKNKIEAINVLKGQSAISLYGDKGKNGVIVITLKK